MGLSHAPRVITDGLVLGLDAANTRSYGGSGTTWTDLIGSNNGTLTNGPVFTQEPKQEPFGGAGAVYFDGTGDYLSLASTTCYLGANDFTVEAWVYWAGNTALSSIPAIISKWSNSGGPFQFLVNATGFTFQYTKASGGQLGATGTTAPSANRWYHVAAVKYGSELKLYVDGVVEATTTGATAILNRNDNVQIGHRTWAGPPPVAWDGYISNLRLTRTALYTSNFTPPRKKLEVTSDTVLLTCEKGTIRDRSSSAHAITINGDAHSITGASYFKFDGTNDAVTIPDNQNFEIGTASSFECWVNIRTVTTDRLPFGKGSTWWFAVGYTTLGGTSGEFQWLAYDGSSWTTLNTGVTVSANTWYHLVTTWDGTYFRFYANGNLEATSSDLSAKTWSNNSNAVDIGGFLAGLQQMTNQKFSVARIYTKTLTAAEVTQNFNALRGRYGI